MATKRKRRGRPKAKPDAEEQRVCGILQAFPPTEQAHLRVLLKRYRRGTASRREEEKLEASGLVGAVSELKPASKTVDSQEALSTVLRTHFAGRITVDISQQQVSNWAKNKPGFGIPKGTPASPVRRGLRYDVQAWIDWIEKFILPTHQANGHQTGPSKFDLASEARAQRDIDDAETSKIQLNVLRGAYKPVEEYIAHLRSVGQVLNQAISDSIEKNIVSMLSEAAKVLPVDETKMAEFRAIIQSVCERASDDQRAALAAALREAGEKAVA